MDKGGVLAKVAENGCVGFPARERTLVGLDKDGLFRINVKDGELRIRPVQVIVADIQRRLAEYAEGPVSAVDMLIEERRREVDQEDRAEYEPPAE